eukprot:gene15828-21442_t
MIFLGFDYLTNLWWALTRLSITSAGACSIKFSQWVATRPDLFPESWCKQLQLLQSRTHKAPSLVELEAILIKNLGTDWKTKINFEYNNDNNKQYPIILGSGCVAQVMKGIIPQTGETIAIKIVHPFVKNNIESDIEVIRFCTTWVEYLFPIAKNISLSDSFEEFRILLIDQLDMTAEAKHLQTFRKNFHLNDNEIIDNNNNNNNNIVKKITNFLKFNINNKDKDNIIDSNQSDHLLINFPKPYFELTSQDVLVESYENGILISKMIKKGNVGMNKKMAQTGLHAFLKMIFIDNFIHADLHAGNIICGNQTNNNNNNNNNNNVVNSLSIIDTGLVITLKPIDRRNFVDLFHSVIMNDGERVGRLMIERSRDSTHVIDPHGFTQEMKLIVNEMYNSGFALGKIGISSLLFRVLRLCYKHQVKLESRYSTILVAIGVLEGLGRELDPDVDIIKVAIPYIMRAALLYKT